MGMEYSGDAVETVKAQGPIAIQFQFKSRQRCIGTMDCGLYIFPWRSTLKEQGKSSSNSKLPIPSVRIKR
jgi:hypothetical protein